VVINEILYDEIGIDTGLSMFIELYAPPGTWLGGLSLRAVNGANGEVYKNVNLPNVQVPFNGYFLIADLGASALLNDIANLLADVDLQNSPDNLELVFNAGTLIEYVIDAVGYGTFATDDVFRGEGSPAPDAAPGESITRDDVHTDSGDNSADFVVSSNSSLGVPTPGGASIPRIHVNLAWDTDATDFDLHLLRGGGVWGTAPGDCFFANRTPDWGVADDPSDDPRLNRDDQDGFGPEFIDLVLPPTGDNYLVEVQSWANTVATVATVTIALEGGGYPDVNELTFQQTISASDIYWAVARINVDATGHLTVDPLDTTSTSPYDN
jgi:hypothetical protein